MASNLPVVAAIPNYNMAEQLEALLPNLRDQEYDDIYVLDDASTDDSVERVEALDLGVKVVSSPENRGAGATRNLINTVLDRQVIIHFLDADIDLLTDDSVVDLIREAVPDEPFGFVGGLAYGPDNWQNIWNFGPRQSAKNDFFSQVHSYISAMAKKDPERAAKWRVKYADHLAAWPDITTDPVRRHIFWNIEQNLLMDSNVFREIPFDPRLREHEIQDLAIRMSGRGLARYFDPSIAVRHKEVDVRHYNRDLAMLKAEVKIQLAHGLGRYFRPTARDLA